MGALLAFIPGLMSILDRLIPDPEARQKAAKEIMDLATKSDIAQLEVNKAEAGTGSLFIGGWRPFIGWVGGFAIAWQFVFKPMILAFGYLLSPEFVTAVLNAPALDQNMWELITAMLGIGALRSYEKIKGVSK